MAEVCGFQVIVSARSSDLSFLPVLFPASFNRVRKSHLPNFYNRMSWRPKPMFLIRIWSANLMLTGFMIGYSSIMLVCAWYYSYLLCLGASDDYRVTFTSMEGVVVRNLIWSLSNSNRLTINKLSFWMRPNFCFTPSCHLLNYWYKQVPNKDLVLFHSSWGW